MKGIAGFIFFMIVVVTIVFVSFKISSTLGAVIFFVLILLLAILCHQSSNETRKINTKIIYDTVTELTNKFIKQLHVKRMQKIKIDEYGVRDDKLWIKEILYFIDNKLLPEIKSRGALDMALIDKVAIGNRIEDLLFNYDKSILSTDMDIKTLNPLEFESFCAKILRENDWAASTTKGSGDQGIDVIAEKNGITAIFQCKKYSSPIGNKAVQEAIAGKVFASADYAFVVSNAEYTPSAKELAAKSGIHLFHYTQLKEIDQYLFKNVATSE